MCFGFLPGPLAAIDTVVNSSCLILSFDEFENHFSRLCKPCRSICEKRCVEKAERVRSRDPEVEGVHRIDGRSEHGIE